MVWPFCVRVLRRAAAQRWRIGRVLENRQVWARRLHTQQRWRIGRVPLQQWAPDLTDAEKLCR